jgi:hypothetical protein
VIRANHIMTSRAFSFATVIQTCHWLATIGHREPDPIPLILGSCIHVLVFFSVLVQIPCLLSDHLHLMKCLQVTVPIFMRTCHLRTSRSLVVSDESVDISANAVHAAINLMGAFSRLEGSGLKRFVTNLTGARW